MTAAQLAIIVADPLNPLVWRNAGMTPAQLAAIIAAIQAAGVTIGNAVSGGTVGRVLYVGAGGLLANDASLINNPAGDFEVNHSSFILKSGATAGAALYSTDGSHTTYLCSGATAGLFIGAGRTIQIASNVEAITYLAGTAASWLTAPPTDVWVAIDRCAALLKTLNGGTGP